MNLLTIDLGNFKKQGIHISYYIPLQMISEGLNPLEYGIVDQQQLLAMQEGGWLKIGEDGELEPRQSLLDLFPPENGINFDEFWDIFPSKTRQGRTLRAANKLFQGKLARDYTVCKKKYLAKIKTQEAHQLAIKAVKARVDNNDYEFINGMEVYINQSKWEADSQYMEVKYHGKDI